MLAVNLHYHCMAEPAEDGNLFGGDSDSSDGSDSRDSSDSVECSLPVAAVAAAASAAAAAAASSAAVATVDTPDAKKEEDGGGVPPPPAHELTKRSSVISAEEGKEGKEDGSGNKEESVLGAASAQAPTAQAHPCSLPGCSLPGGLRCSACKTAFYCSKKHQRSAWRAHKPECRETSALMVDGSGGSSTAAASTDADRSISLGDKTNTGGVGNNSAADGGGSAAGSGGGGDGGGGGGKSTGKLPLFMHPNYIRV